MNVLYIFPHPDDESFGVGHVMSFQRRQGHHVHLLTLTKGGATRQRHRYNLSVEEMGEVRHKEMKEVAKTLDLTGLRVCDLPDSGLKEMDPREIEGVVEEQILRLKPQVVVSYPVHGISGFHDHLIIHGIVKRVFLELKEKDSFLKRLAFNTIRKEEAEQFTFFHLSGSTDDEIDCRYRVDDVDIEKCRKALDCYVTFQETIENSGIKKAIHHRPVFEFFQENFDPWVSDLFHGL